MRTATGLQGLPNEIALMTTNLPHGYHRDFQLLKENLFPALETLHTLFEMTHFMLSHISVNNNILEDEKYRYLFTVEKVNELVLRGVPFREAYQQVGREVQEGTFSFEPVLNPTHAGSIGNLCTDAIRTKMVKAAGGIG